MSRVLLVDDEKNVLKSLAIGLGRHAYDVCKAQSGPEALKILEEQRFDIVVSDVRMKPMDGYTLASNIHDKYPHVRIVLMSAFGFDDGSTCVGESYICHRLTKPFAVADLIEVLRREGDASPEGLFDQSEPKGHVLVFSEHVRENPKGIFSKKSAVMKKPPD